MNRRWSWRLAVLLTGALLVPVVSATAVAACYPWTPTGLVSGWYAENDYTDCTGTNTGTQVGSVPFAAGKYGQAFSYSQNAANYVDLGNAPTLKFTDALTIAAWIYPTAQPDPANLRAIVTKWGQQFSPTPQPGDDSYGLWTEYDPSGTPRIFGALNLDTGTGPSEPHADGGTVPLNQWSHVAMTFDRAAPGNNLVVYVNCQPVSAVAGGNYPINNTSDKRVLIGREDSGQTRPFAGLIDEVMIFNRALSAAEISSLVTNVDPGACAVPVELSRFVTE